MDYLNGMLELVIKDADGKEIAAFAFSAAKPSSNSGKMNRNASGKVLLPSGDKFQLGCNLTRIG